MGVNIGYYVVNDDQLKLLPEAEDFDTALNEDVLFFHEDEPFVFK